MVVVVRLLLPLLGAALAQRGLGLVQKAPQVVRRSRRQGVRNAALPLLLPLRRRRRRKGQWAAPRSLVAAGLVVKLSHASLGGDRGRGCADRHGDGGARRGHLKRRSWGRRRGLRRGVDAAAHPGRSEVMAWAFERPAGGRSFAFSGGHWYGNWLDSPETPYAPAQRRVVAQGILWTAGVTIPDGGVAVDVDPAEAGRYISRRP